MIGNVVEFHKKFGLPLGAVDYLAGEPTTQEFRTGFIQEELDELKCALTEGDKVGVFDALLDLAYVVYGTALFAGISPAQWHAGMHAVHSANMAKVRVAKAEDSKRGSAFDCKKPEGWVGPEARLKEILSW
jgi:predicted HAD superfamily Cof-like phosphohydrolase